MLRIVSWLFAATILYTIGAKTLAPSSFHDHDYGDTDDSGGGFLEQDLGGWRIRTSPDGAVYVAGSGMSDGTTNGYDFVLIKYLVVGGALQFQWEKHYDGPAGSDDAVCGLVLNATGDRIYVGGTSWGTSTDKDFAVVGWDTNGVPLWDLEGGEIAARCDIDNHPDIAYGMNIDVNGNILMCGSHTASNDLHAMAVVIEPDGDIKSGWPMTYSAASTYDAVFNAVDSDPTSSKVWCAGYKGVSGQGKNILVVRYSGAGSQLAALSTNYESLDDEANDIVFTKNGRVAVAGYVTKDLTVDETRYAVLAYDELNLGAAWTKVDDDVSKANAVAYRNDYVYATGVDNETSPGPDGFLTTKMALSNGAYDTNFSGDGRVMLIGSDKHVARSVWVSGTNVYVTGSGKSPGSEPTPQSEQYATVGYSKSGGEILGPDYFPPDPPIDAEPQGGWSTAVRAPGRVFVTGNFYDDDNSDGYVGLHDFGSGLYLASTSTAAPGSNFTVLTGTRTDGNSNPLDSSDNTKLVVEHGTEATSLAQVVAVEINGNVGVSPEVTELSFEVESLSESTIVQTVWLYNYDSGQYENFDSRAATTSDRTLYIAIPGDPDPYINGSGAVKAKLRYTVSGSPSSNWGASMDLGIWRYIN